MDLNGDSRSPASPVGCSGLRERQRVCALGGQNLTLPNTPGSLKFAVIGGNGY
jgi:hypothetical protein